MIANYTSTPVLVQAAQWLPDDDEQRVLIQKWLADYELEYQPDGSLLIFHLDDPHLAVAPGDWIVEVDDGIWVSPNGEFQDLFTFQNVIADPKQLTLF